MQLQVIIHGQMENSFMNSVKQQIFHAKNFILAIISKMACATGYLKLENIRMMR